MSEFQLLETSGYYDQLYKKIIAAKKSIYITSLDFIYDSTTKKLLDAIEVACKNGVKVYLSADTLTFHELRHRSFGPIDTTHESSKEIRDFVTRIEAAGGAFYWLGDTDKWNPYIRRNHQKWSIVDDHIFSFGGINMYDSGLHNNDFMFYTHNSSFAELLRNEHEKIVQSPHTYEGLSTSINSSTECMIDSIHPKTSLIYNMACELAEKATHTTYVSQFYPTGPLLKHLKSSPTEFFINRPSQLHGLAKYMVLFDRLRTGIKNNYERSTYLHAKCIIFTMPDGTKHAITGSHNFSYAGVRFGTVEIALHTTEKSIITQIEAFIDRSVR